MTASRFVGTSLFKDETLSDQVTLYYCQRRQNLNVHNINLFVLRPSRKAMDCGVPQYSLFGLRHPLLFHQMNGQLSNTRVGNGL